MTTTIAPPFYQVEPEEIDTIWADIKPEIERALPAGLKVKIAYDGTKYIDDALKEMLRTRIIPTPPNIAHLVWESDYTGYRQYNVKCACTTSMGTACRRWCVGYRDGVTPVCMAHFTPTPTLPPAAIERRREVAAARRAIRRASHAPVPVSVVPAHVSDLNFTDAQTARNKIRVILFRIDIIRFESGSRVATDLIEELRWRVNRIRSEMVARFGVGVLAPDAGFTEVTEVTETTDECPICLESYALTRKAVCGHHACSECCSSMKASGRTICCPLCRDRRFVGLVNHAPLV
jgi:hypothetical protein